jgi:hypothetical protein
MLLIETMSGLSFFHLDYQVEFHMAEDDEKLEVLFTDIPSDWDDNQFVAYLKSGKYGGEEIKDHKFDKERRTAVVTFANNEGLTHSCSCCNTPNCAETQLLAKTRNIV